ncbi:MAG: Ig-like domain-containing protein [Aggregatilineales bacterium]
MRKLAPLLLILFAILSISVPQLLAQDAVAARTVLQVVETDPLGGQEAGLTDSITLFFDRELNCESAERAFNISPGIDGTLDCDGSRLIFTPDVPYERAIDYTIILADSIESENGVTLLDDYQFMFTTTGYLSVTETFPANGAFDVTADSAITVIFNRPIVPLTVSGSDIDLPDPLTFDPPVTGTGDWLNTSIYVFTPDSGLAGGTTYAAIVNPPLDAIDDSILQDAYRWSFSTQSPQITQTFPAAQANGVALNEMIQVTFNQPMNRESVENNFYLRITGTPTGAFPGTFEWNDDDTGFGFTPDDDLSLNGFYVAGFDDGIQAAAGSATLEGMTSWNFATANSPGIVGSEPTDGATDVPVFGGLWLYFSSRMDVDTLADKITILPEPSREPTYIYQESSEAYFVQFPVESGTDYAVSVAPGMADIYGNTIDTTFALNYRTANLQPDVQLQVPGSVGVYNAYRNPTELFLTHVNVSQVDLQLYGVSVEDFSQRLAGESYYNPTQNYVPQPANLLRQWQIESVAPLNTGRYERLVPANAGVAPPVITDADTVECPGALPTRLQIGDIAVVDSEPDPVRVRTEPGGDIVDLLYKDYQLPVIDGPACPDGNLRWWQVRLRDGNNAWIAESVGQEYLLNISVPVAPPVTQSQPPVDPGTGNLNPGIYYLQAASPETQNLGYDPQQHFMVLATTNLTVKTTVDSMTVWATDLQSGLPVADAPIAIYDDQHNQVASGTTNADGIMQIAMPRISDLYVRQTVVLDDGTNFGLGFTEWTEGIDPWQFNQQYDFYPREYALYVYTDRPIYRPGQPVYFRGIVRGKNDLNYTLPDLDGVPVQIFDNQGNIVFEESLDITDYGGFSAQLDLSDDAGVGYYYIQIDLPSEGIYNSEGGGVGFNVAEFRLPEFVVEVTADDDEVVQGDRIDITIENRFFFGGAVSGAQVEYYVSGRPHRFDYQGDGFYDFYDFADQDEFYGRILSEEAMTDDNGMLTFSFPADLEVVTESRLYEVEAVVRDESNQTVSGRTQVIVHPGDVFIGARPQRYISTADEETVIELISVDVDSAPVPNQEIDVEVVERRWSNVQEQDETGRTTFNWNVEEIPVTDATITTDENGDALYSFVPPAGGVYKVRLTTRDSQGNVVQSATTVWVSGSNYVAWRQDNNNRLEYL